MRPPGLVLLVLGSQADQIVDLGPGRTIDIITSGILALAVLFGLPLAVIAVFGRRQQQLNDAMSKMGDGPSHGAPHVGPNDLDT